MCNLLNWRQQADRNLTMKQDGRKVQGALQILANKQTYDLTGKEKIFELCNREKHCNSVYVTTNIWKPL